MEQIQQTTQQKTRAMSQGYRNMVHYLQNLLQNFGDTARVYIHGNPPLAAFLFTLLIFSAIPISIYVIFAATTLAVTLSLAMIGSALGAGTLLLIGGGILLVILFGITAMTSVGFSWLFGFWLVYRGGCMLWKRFGSSASTLSDVVTGQIRHVTQATSERIQQLQHSAQEQAHRAQR